MITAGVVLAAGKGTRMAPYTDAVAKELLLIGEKPVIEYNIKYMSDAGIERVFVVLSEGKEQIIRYIKDGKWLGVRVAYLFQDMKVGMGTAKAIETAKPWVNQGFLVAYGDAFFHPGGFMKEMLRFHEARLSHATIGLYRVKNPLGFGVVKTGPEGEVIDIVEGPTLEEAEAFKTKDGYLVNSGPLTFSPEVFDYIERTTPSPSGEYWVTETIRLMLGDGRRVYGFKIPSTVFWRDVGTPMARLEADEYAMKAFALKKRKA